MSMDFLMSFNDLLLIQFYKSLSALTRWSDDITFLGGNDDINIVVSTITRTAFGLLNLKRPCFLELKSTRNTCFKIDAKAFVARLKSFIETDKKVNTTSNDPNFGAEISHYINIEDSAPIFPTSKPLETYQLSWIARYDLWEDTINFIPKNFDLLVMNCNPKCVVFKSILDSLETDTTLKSEIEIEAIEFVNYTFPGKNDIAINFSLKDWRAIIQISESLEEDMTCFYEEGESVHFVLNISNFFICHFTLATFPIEDRENSKEESISTIVNSDTSQ
ncbi:hypothetical protein ROZALSC1DRAFT_30188 [Rozella allomycis CSF55]|uniref:Uncharacterized protein n=1 Tax=Rozella allomycis (strain CSF55) TaxID=988480 RepID=A0A075AUD8_ROZAC|nr:hypothetical protein O9G_002596 [Rozella allomycis CSF55]RKP18076.1 hypothetical protein ROZALSC1DRAFT_30188 [Rozella allomycis CSF55]|eukprot:EPZ32102.1 hypothetical protein O9G_002596 [Rozella allomycis CSF55]